MELAAERVREVAREEGEQVRRALERFEKEVKARKAHFAWRRKNA